MTRKIKQQTYKPQDYWDKLCHCPIPEPKKLIGACKTKDKEKVIKTKTCSRCGGEICVE